MTEVLWNRMTAAELNEKAEAGAIVLLPVASTEQHGPHLATGVDTFLAGEACLRTAKRVTKQRPIVVTPTLWVGLAEHHMAFGGTLTVSLSTYHAVLQDLCRSIGRAGFKKVLIINGHGGNIAALSAFTTELTLELDMPIASTEIYTLAHESGRYKEVLEDQQGVQHACEAETSMMMAAFNDCVRSDNLPKAHGPMAVPGGTALRIWKSFKEFTPSGVRGDARKATAEKGEHLLEIATELLAEKLINGAPWN